MTTAVKRILLSLLITTLLITASGAGTSTVLGVDEDCLNPETSDQCSADSYVHIRGVLDAVFEVAYTALQYAGFITVCLGSVIWFTASKNSDRARNGLWLFVGGILMIGFYFIFTAFIGLLSWISGG
jgi:uncharacterized membrane protein